MIVGPNTSLEDVRKAFPGSKRAEEVFLHGQTMDEHFLAGARRVFREMREKEALKARSASRVPQAPAP